MLSTYPERMLYRIRILLLSLVIGVMSASAQEALVCEKLLSSGSATTDAYITCSTDSAGRVLIAISPAANGDTQTAFRGNGLAAAGFKYDGQPIGDFFSRAYSSSVITYTPLDGASLEAGKLITYNKYAESTYAEWKTAQDGNAYTTGFSFSYSYGGNCTKLATPTITAINGSIPVFDPIEGATSYSLTVRLNGIIKHIQTIQPGGAIAFTSLLDGSTNYEVTLRACADGRMSSDESAPFIWPLDGESPTIGMSEYCQYRIGSAGDEAFLVWETLADGDVEITLLGGAATYFRGNGLAAASLSGFTVGSVPASTYFSRILPSSNPTTFTLHLKNPAIAPIPGEKIRYSGNVEWKTASNSNAYQAISCTYTYGSVCTQLDTPVLTAISADSIPQFDAVPNATSYLAKVYADGVLKYYQTIRLGDRLRFAAEQDGFYQVTLTAKANGYLDSEESDPVDWHLFAAVVDLGDSEYCGTAIGSGVTSASITWLTLDNGDVEISISGDESTWFRGNGMGSASLAQFTVAGLSASAYFERVFEGTRSLTYVLHLRDTTFRPALGSTIRFSGTVEWATSGNSNAYGTYSYAYTYGTSCPQMERPTIQSVSLDGTVTLADTIAGATAYRVLIYRGELLMYSKRVSSLLLSDFQLQIPDFTPTATYLYTVYLQTIGPSGRVPSALSEPYFWHLTAPEVDLMQSSLCQQLLVSDVYLSAVTDYNGAIRFTLSGSAGATWRANGLSTSSMFIAGFPIENFFRKSVGDTVLTLSPRGNLSGVIFEGDKITYTAPVEWATALNTNAYTTLTFTYTYGTNCEPLLPRLDAPAELAVSEVGQVSFQAVANAASYQTKVVDVDWDVLRLADISSGDTIAREQSVLADFTYYVAVRALPADAAVYRPSRWSESVEWIPSYLAAGDDPYQPVDPDDDLPEDDDERDEPVIVFPEDVALEDIVIDVPVCKFIHGGQLYIYYYGHVYSVYGMLIN